MRARGVIGASYGDEGKGRTVDWLCARSATPVTVVRSNGGAQAGHTVARADGRRHVFHQLGSGALAGAATHLSRFMVSHPMILAEELAAVRGLGGATQVSADSRGFVTTPWDMMLNQAVELARGDGRHGSCGLGFGETVERCEKTPFTLTVGDLFSGGLRAKLVALRDEWLPTRIAQLGLDPSSSPLALARAVPLAERFERQCDDFAETVRLLDDDELGGAGAIVFEGAQGLLLDQNGAGFPYVTRSNTGLANMVAIALEASIVALDPVYVTRAYLTRHGRGPMEDERAIDGWFMIEDPTNRPNPWQESLRFGLVDPARLARRIAADCALTNDRLEIRPTIAVTCLDQARRLLAWCEDGAVRDGTLDEFLDALETAGAPPCEVTFSAP